MGADIQADEPAACGRHGRYVWVAWVSAKYLIALEDGPVVRVRLAGLCDEDVEGPGGQGLLPVRNDLLGGGGEGLAERADNDAQAEHADGDKRCFMRGTSAGREV